MDGWVDGEENGGEEEGTLVCIGMDWMNEIELVVSFLL